jgi:hypothetical protein
MTNEQNATRKMMSLFLSALGFEAMAKDVLTANEEVLPRYARIIIKQSPQSMRAEIVSQFRTLRLVA